MPFKYNPITGKLDRVEGGAADVSADPDFTKDKKKLADREAVDVLVDAKIAAALTTEYKAILDNVPKAYDPAKLYQATEQFVLNEKVYTTIDTMTVAAGPTPDMNLFKVDIETHYRGRMPGTARPLQTTVPINTNRWIYEGDYVVITSDGTVDGVDLKTDDILRAKVNRPSTMTEWSLNRATDPADNQLSKVNFNNDVTNFTPIPTDSQDAFNKLYELIIAVSEQGDAAAEWVAAFDYVGDDNKLFTFTTASTTAVDVKGNPIDANTNYVGKYPTDKTSSATLDDAELLTIEVLGVSTSSSFRYVNPDSGDDAQKGTTVGTDWNTFAPINDDPDTNLLVTIAAGATEIPAITIDRKNVILNFEAGAPRVRRIVVKDSNVVITGSPTIEAFTVQGGELTIDSPTTIQGEGISNFYDAFRVEKGDVFVNANLTFTGGHRYAIHVLANGGQFKCSTNAVIDMNGYNCTGLIVGGGGRISLPSQTIATGAVYEFGISVSGSASVWRPTIAQTVEDEFAAATDTPATINGFAWLEGWSNHPTIIERFVTTDLLAPYITTSDPITRITVTVGRTANGWQAIGDFAINLIGGGTIPPANMTLENVTGGVITTVEAQSIIDGNFTGLAFPAIGDTESFDIVFDTPRSDIESLSASGRADWPTTGIGFTTQTQGNPSQTNKILAPVQTVETFPIFPIEPDTNWHWGHFTDGTGTGARAVNNAGVVLFEVHEVDGIRIPAIVGSSLSKNVLTYPVGNFIAIPVSDNASGDDGAVYKIPNIDSLTITLPNKADMDAVNGIYRIRISGDWAGLSAQATPLSFIDDTANGVEFGSGLPDSGNEWIDIVYDAANDKWIATSGGDVTISQIIPTYTVHTEVPATVRLYLIDGTGASAEGLYRKETADDAPNHIG